MTKEEGDVFNKSLDSLPCNLKSSDSSNIEKALKESITIHQHVPLESWTCRVKLASLCGNYRIHTHTLPSGNLSQCMLSGA